MDQPDQQMDDFIVFCAVMDHFGSNSKCTNALLPHLNQFVKDRLFSTHNNNNTTNRTRQNNHNTTTTNTNTNTSVHICAICKRKFTDKCVQCVYNKVPQNYVCPISWGTCGHYFHSHCIERWLKIGKTNCPHTTLPPHKWEYQIIK